MSGLVSLLAAVVLAVLVGWVLAGVVLRAGGALFAIGGLLAWLAGHWLFVVRHRYPASRLARVVFGELLPRARHVVSRRRVWALRLARG
jgi:hypothetical protein